MGGHGGLNITMQKSYAPYTRKNRERVERDERELAETQAAARAAEAAAASALRLERLRAEGLAPPAPLEHVNFFAEEEAALLTEHADAEARRREKEQLRRLMPDCELGRSASEPQPWYLRTSSAAQSAAGASQMAGGHGGGGGAAAAAAAVVAM
ncbi:hypothetical protein KFE25_013333 [Diacronema lutheri]|uniref:CBF1-interacting co-repressor CIR N-terminal domain-containing protein n=1 Tax=Diacronema lutheri TaxID=2081491 RepID=A0A8J5XZA2_DIALT|nr:hypothetical protein KFE25_013333 [Diacronema lutheri]